MYNKYTYKTIHSKIVDAWVNATYVQENQISLSLHIPCCLFCQVDQYPFAVASFDKNIGSQPPNKTVMVALTYFLLEFF